MFKNRGWTEKAYIINFIVALLLVQEMLVLTCIFPASDIASIATVAVPSVFTEVSVFSAFIIWKNKTENINKYKENCNGDCGDDLCSSSDSTTSIYDVEG